MTETYFFLKRKTGPMPRARIAYSVAHSERERQIVIKAYQNSQDAHLWELIETDANGNLLPDATKFNDKH